MIRKSAPLLALAVALSVLSGCNQSDAQDRQGQRGPTQVGFVVMQRTSVPVQSLLGGRTVAFESSEVRPQVNGVIRRRYFTEGSYVRQGQPLYQIDPSLYRAAVNQAQANVAAARATLDAAQVRANRYKPLAEMEAISQQDYTDAALRPGRPARLSPRIARSWTRRGSISATPASPPPSAAGSVALSRRSAHS